MIEEKYTISRIIADRPARAMLIGHEESPSSLLACFYCFFKGTREENRTIFPQIEFINSVVRPKLINNYLHDKEKCFKSSVLIPHHLIPHKLPCEPMHMLLTGLCKSILIFVMKPNGYKRHTRSIKPNEFRKVLSLFEVTKIPSISTISHDDLKLKGS